MPTAILLEDVDRLGAKGAVVDGSLWVGNRIGTGFATIAQQGRSYASYAGIVAQQ